MTAQNDKKLKHWVKMAIILLIFDIIAVNLSFAAALFLRYDCRPADIPPVYLQSYLKYIPVNTICTVIILFLMNLYKSLWRFASYNELERILIASALSIGLHIWGMNLLFGHMPAAYYFIGGILEAIAITGGRFAYRLIRLIIRRNNAYDIAHRKNAMVIGAGDAGLMIIKELIDSEYLNVAVKCVIDDNSNKKGRYINGVPIIGGREEIISGAEKYKIDQIFFAIPSATDKEKRAILNICKETGCELKSLPGLYQLVNGEVSVSQLRNVSVEELLGREQLLVDMSQIAEYVSGKTVLVTGGGGSIGSELCRQIAMHNPKLLIILDIYENNVYDIEQELKLSYPELSFVSLIGSVTDKMVMDNLFAKYRPDIVYHAAAHKHVPLMEGAPAEAVRNNIFGTMTAVKAADKFGVKRFVLISTDKAVNPTNIMGATKRVCEMIVQIFDKKSKTEFVAVRFGNVLGSNGSVIPLFKKQIAAGGPVTVTHPDIIRYFMTIPEAVSLVMQAGAYAKGGEIFILDMGEPVKIVDLAKNMIRLSGLTPEVDIDIVYTGLRPGEKLYEEKLMAEEGLMTTANQMIHVGKPIEIDTDIFSKKLEALYAACMEDRDDIIKDLVADIVPTYTITE